MIMARIGEVYEGEELFGECQTPGFRDSLDYDVGAKPHIERPKKRPYL
jgi:hypothetical protein